jgi:hypothetical protein
MSLSRLLRFRPSLIKLRPPSRFYSSDHKALFYPQAFVPNVRPILSDVAPRSNESLRHEDLSHKPCATLKKWMQTIAESKTVLSEQSGLIDSICSNYSIICEESRADATDVPVETLAENWTFPRSMLIGPLLFTLDQNAFPDYEVWEHGNRLVARTLFATYRAKDNRVHARWPDAIAPKGTASYPNAVPFGAIGLRLSAIWSPIMPKAECSSLIARGRHATTWHDRLLLVEEIQKLMHAYDSPIAIANTQGHESLTTSNEEKHRDPRINHDVVFLKPPRLFNTRRVFAAGSNDFGAQRGQRRLQFAYDTPTKDATDEEGRLTMGSYHMMTQTLFPYLHGGMAIKLHLRVDRLLAHDAFTADQTESLREIFAPSLLLHSGMTQI